jgi:hypothetical protein
MSSTTQSAENCIANGLTFNISDIEITAPKLNKSGGKSANILYKPSKKGLYVNMEVPMLTWGASMFKDPQSGKETYDMSIQFPRKDYSTPETDILLGKFQEIEKFIKSEAVRNSMAWFNKKTMTPEVIDALWTPILKYSKDPHTGEADMTKSPTLKVKLPYWDGKFNCEIYDTQGTMLYPDDSTGSSPLELIPKGVNIVAIIQCGGLWFANGKFGCTWRLFQSVVQPKPTMKGKCWINVSPAAKNALAAASAAANESSMVIEDDESDGEEAAPPLPVKTTTTRPVPAPAPVVEEEEEVAVPAAAPVVVAAPAVEVPAVVKKKIVRKKD